MRFWFLLFAGVLGAQPDLFPIRTGRQFGFINRAGGVVIAPRFDRVEPFREGRAVVWVGALAGYIDTAGTMVIPAGFTTATSFENGRALVSREGKYAVIDAGGKVINEVPYRVLGGYSDGLAVVQRPRSGATPGAYGYIDREGRIAIEPRFMPAGAFPADGRGLAVGGLERQWCYFDKTGKILLRLPMEGHDRAPGFHDGLVVWKEGFYWGYRDATGAWAIPAQFDDARDFERGMASVEKDGKWVRIDTRGNVLPPAEGPRAIAAPADGLTRAADGDRLGYLRPDGAAAFPFRKYDEAHDFHCGLARVKVDGKYGYLDKAGKLAIPNRYAGAGDFEGCLAQVLTADGWAWIDPAGKAVWTSESRL